MGLVPARIPQQPWTLITYSFLHGGFGHLFFNMLGLYFFGPRLEERLGGGHFLGLYVVSAVVGGLASWPVTPHAMIVGASGAVYGVLLGFARYWPRQQIMLLIPPIPMEARTLVIVFAVISLVLGLTGSGGIAHFAHLGGFVGGWLYLKWRESRSPAARFKAKARPVPKVRELGTDLKEWAAARREEMHPVNRAELDRILDKIGAAGMASLSADERAFLERFQNG
jgi:membrane associated rhomboid family serine protease